MSKSIPVLAFFISIAFSMPAESSKSDADSLNGGGSEDLAQRRTVAPVLSDDDDLKKTADKINEVKEDCQRLRVIYNELKNQHDKCKSDNSLARGKNAKKKQALEEAAAKLTPAKNNLDNREKHLTNLLKQQKELEKRREEELKKAEEEKAIAAFNASESMEKLVKGKEVVLEESQIFTDSSTDGDVASQSSKEDGVPQRLTMSEELVNNNAGDTEVSNTNAPKEAAVDEKPVAKEQEGSKAALAAQALEPQQQQENIKLKSEKRLAEYTEKADALAGQQKQEDDDKDAPDMEVIMNAQKQTNQESNIRKVVQDDFDTDYPLKKKQGWTSWTLDKAYSACETVVATGSAFVSASSAVVAAGSSVIEKAGTAGAYGYNYGTNLVSRAKISREERFDKAVCPMMTILDFLHEVREVWFKGLDDTALNKLRSKNFFCCLQPKWYAVQTQEYNGAAGYHAFLGKVTAGPVRLVLKNKTTESKLNAGDLAEQNERKARKFKTALISADTENALQNFSGILDEQQVSPIEYLHKIKGLIEKGELQLFMTNLNQCRHATGGLHTHSMIVQTVFAFDEKTGDSYHVSLWWFRVWEQLTQDDIKAKYEIFKTDPKLGALLEARK